MGWVSLIERDVEGDAVGGSSNPGRKELGDYILSTLQDPKLESRWEAYVTA